MKKAYILQNYYTKEYVKGSWGEECYDTDIDRATWYDETKMIETLSRFANDSSSHGFGGVFIQIVVWIC